MIILWVYVIGAVVLILPIGRVAARIFAGDFDTDEYGPDPADYACAAAISIPLAGLWPLVLLGYGVYRALRKEAAE